MAGIAATIDRFEGGQAVLRLADGQELVVARGELPAGSREGSVVTVRFTGAPEAEADQAATARQLLNEILRGRE